MNAVRGEICGFVENDGLSLVSISTALGEFSVLMLGFSQSLNAKKGSKVELLFKENELILAKMPDFANAFGKVSVENVSGAKKVGDGKSVGGVACENAFKGVVASIDKGELLWEVFLKGFSLNKTPDTKNSSTKKGSQALKTKDLTDTTADLNLSALITAKAGKHLNLSPKDEVVGFVKPSDIIIKVL